VGVPDDRWGETPVAVVALQDGAGTTAEELIAYARERLAHFKCPTRVEFVPELPRNATGKVLKTVLRQQHGGGEHALDCAPRAARSVGAAGGRVGGRSVCVRERVCVRVCLFVSMCPCRVSVCV